MGARRLAASSVDPWIGRLIQRGTQQNQDTRDRPVEDARQSAPNSFGSLYVPRIACRVADAADISMGVDWIYPCDDFDSRADSLSHGTKRAAQRNFQAKPHSRRAVRSFAGRIPDRLDGHPPGLPGMADVRRDLAHAWTIVHNAQKLVAVGYRGA